jgi:predicted CopG family antitoxin
LVADVVNKLRALRGPGQSFSDVILTLAKGEGAARGETNV